MMIPHSRRNLTALIMSAVAALATTALALQPSTRPSGPATRENLDAPVARLQATDTDALRAHLGKVVTVEGTVRSARVSSSGKVARIQFEGTETFLAVVFDSAFADFAKAHGDGWLEQLSGKRVEVVGTVSEYRENPQVILRLPRQVKVLP